MIFYENERVKYSKILKLNYILMCTHVRHQNNHIPNVRLHCIQSIEFGYSLILFFSSLVSFLFFYWGNPLAYTRNSHRWSFCYACLFITIATSPIIFMAMRDRRRWFSRRVICVNVKLHKKNYSIFLFLVLRIALVCCMTVRRT